MATKKSGTKKNTGSTKKDAGGAKLAQPTRVDLTATTTAAAKTTAADGGIIRSVQDIAERVDRGIAGAATNVAGKIDGASYYLGEKIVEASRDLKESLGNQGQGFQEKECPISDEIKNASDNIGGKISELNDRIRNGVGVNLRRAAIPQTDDVGLWIVIRNSTNAISFNNYNDFMNVVLCGIGDDGEPVKASRKEMRAYSALRRRRFLPFNDTDAYRLLKVATEAFLLVNSGITLNNFPAGDDPDEDRENGFPFNTADIADLNTRLNGGYDAASVGQGWDRYLENVNGHPNSVLPYLAVINNKIGGDQIKNQIFRFEDPLLDPRERREAERCIGVLRRKLTKPFLLELIWSYWHEEGMLVQTLNAISRRFQNIGAPNGLRDPLANLEIDTLRPVNNLIWGYVQDEQHRLSLLRRAYEYDHHYGISLEGKAVPRMHAADSRSKFIEAFHQLLHLCSQFFKQDDDTTVIADGFPILNALKEVHLILSQGAHNQFGDLPSTARQEMLLQQWLLARPEFREFLPTRAAVSYPEPWMDRVEAMKSVQGWTDTSIIHFHNLAVFGEQILLSIRYGDWTNTYQTANAANWARFWRAEMQGYIHAYRAVTGVDLSSVSSSNRIDSTPPSVHLRNRLAMQMRRL